MRTLSVALCLALVSVACIDTSEPPKAAPVTGKWEVKESVSKMDSSPEATLILPAENIVRVYLGTARYKLVIHCSEGKLEIYVDTGNVSQPEGASDQHTVRLRFDDAPPVREKWIESTDGGSLFSPSALKLGGQLARSKRLRFESTPLQLGPQVAEFDLTGLSSVLEKVHQACHI